MVKIFLLIFCAAGLLTACDVRKTDKMADTPVLKEVKESTTVEIIDSVYDFGKIAEGDNVEFSYRFKNSGTKPLVISEASASCGCTVPEKPEKPILPGEMGFIKVKFNSQGRPGQAHKTVQVSSNAQPGFPQLLLKGEVEKKAAE